MPAAGRYPPCHELAAARLRSLAAGDIESRLGDRFRLLTGGYKSALPRQQTLRALIDWSYDLLDDAERSVLRRLSVFAGNFDLAAAEEVAAGDNVGADTILDVVASLVDKSLVQLEASGPSARYRLLDTVRHYAAQRLAEDTPEDERATRDRHAALFLRLADSAAEHFERPDEEAWQDRLEADNANLGLAFHHLATRAASGDDLLRLADTLYRFSVTRGAIQEHLGLLRAALAHPGAQQPTAARAQALLATSSALVRSGGGRREASELQYAALTIARELDEPCLTARVLANLSGSIVMTSSSPEAVAEASELAEEGVSLSRSACPAEQLAAALRARSAVHSFAERYEEACCDGQEAAELFRTAGNTKGLARVLNNLACDEIALGRLDDAQRHLQEALVHPAQDTSNTAFVLGTSRSSTCCAATPPPPASLRSKPSAASRRTRKACCAPRPCTWRSTIPPQAGRRQRLCSTARSTGWGRSRSRLTAGCVRGTVSSSPMCWAPRPLKADWTKAAC